MPASAANDLAVVELRQYTLVPGRREVLIDLFERAFIEPQEEAGMRVIGHFRDRGHPDRFVWLRGFRDMPTRKAALEAFYDGEVWREHRDAANATMVDSDDVLLLRPVDGSTFENGTRPSRGRGVVTATIWPFAEPLSRNMTRLFAVSLTPILRATGATPVALLVSDPSENDFPRLPVREGENVVVSLARFDDSAASEAHAAELDQWRRWQELSTAGRPQTLQLDPCVRSRLA